MSDRTKATLAGWGANLRAECFLTEPSSSEEVSGLLDRSGTIARGLGRSYGDCAINANGQVIGTRRMHRLITLDEATGTLACEGGASLESIQGGSRMRESRTYRLCARGARQ